MKKLDKLSNSTLAGIASNVLRWEQRQHVWEAKWQDSEDPSELYRRLADVAIAHGFNDLTNVQPLFLNLTKSRLPLKKVAESLMGHSLPDINPKKCIEFARETPIGAESWFAGCTDLIESV